MSEEYSAFGRTRRSFLATSGAAGALALAGCLGGGGDEAYGDGTLDFNVSPSVAQEDLEVQYAPVKNHLSEEADVPAEMNLASNYSAVITALDSGTADIAETGPFAAALGAKSDKAEIILQRKGYGSWEYKSGIAIRQDSDISSLEDLEGKTVAFADRLSNSGTLMPLNTLKDEAGLNVGNLPTGDGADADFEANFAGSHTASYENLASGQVDAAAMGGFVPGVVDGWDGTAEWLSQRDGLARAPIVVSPELTDDEKQTMIDAFVNAPQEIYYGQDGEEGGGDDLWFNGVREVGVDKYQPVIDAANNLGVGTEIFEQV